MDMNNKIGKIPKEPVQQSLELGPDAIPGRFNQTYQTQIFSTANDPNQNIAKGFKSTDLIPFFMQDRRSVSIAGKVSAAEATSTRLIEVDGKSASLIQRAANITSKIGRNKGNEIFRHLGEREETVLDALKYIASRSPGSFGEFQGHACLKFTIGQIESVIESSYNRHEIEEALDVLHGSDTELRLQIDNSGECKPIKSALLPLLITNENTDTPDMFDDNSKLLCTFHPLITRDLASMNFRQIDYVRIRTRRSGLAKILEKRLSHNYTQASEHLPFGPIFGSSILRGAGLNYDKSREADANFKPLTRALSELTVPKGRLIEDLTPEERKTFILARVEIERIYEESMFKRKRIIDYKYTMHPTEQFIKQQIEANTSAKKDLARLSLAKQIGVWPKDVGNLKLETF